jgi:hypothetical protein
MTEDETQRIKRDGNDPANRWQEDENGNLVMPQLQREFLEWLLTVPRPGTQAQWAREHGCDERAVRRWKTDARFKREWEARAKELNISTERVQTVLDNLYLTASTNQGPAGVKAADLYLQYVGKFLPTQRVVTVEDDLEKLSNEDLARLAAGDM